MDLLAFSFNAKTIFDHPSIKKFMKLIRSDYVDDDGDLHLNESIDNINPQIENVKLETT